ncbi:TniB family NTP-binding protein [Pseudomonas helleri]|jgi:predicted AAA+ superfamily ATPase|uniref:AAA family ATPase n=1 Tax=Pseudomonas helleri TaxID=1608996 RepID=A0A6G1VZV3_9PSED|nr:TniB family NTP-binding protein [Pseudomonas helleri]MQT24312.1 AAA family ATPase [Pseudomonas helleri]MQU15294.1 AAA family ATPase [Pseudomonas helleri]
MSTIANELVGHARFNTVHGHLVEVLTRARAGDPQILPIVGPTRVGKTCLLDNFRAMNSTSGTSRSREIISVVSPKHLTGRALPDACLTSIDMNPALFNNHVAATDAFIKAVNKHGARLIIFDETQHMLERGSSTTVRAAADFLKGLFDQAQASIVLAGLPSLMGLFYANEQLADRARRPVEYFPYYWQGKDYISFRSALGSALDYLEDSGWDTFEFNDRDFAQRMYVATAGRYGLINKIFIEVQALAGTVKIARYEAFARAFEQAVMNRLIEFNPFDVDQTIQTEHMALVYAKVMQEAGVKV